MLLTPDELAVLYLHCESSVPSPRPPPADPAGLTTEADAEAATAEVEYPLLVEATLSGGGAAARGWYSKEEADETGCMAPGAVATGCRGGGGRCCCGCGCGAACAWEWTLLAWWGLAAPTMSLLKLRSPLRLLGSGGSPWMAAAMRLILFDLQ